MKEETVDLTLDELLGLKDTVLIRNIKFEITIDGNVNEMERKVTFRRLTYGEVNKLSDIPEDKPLRYASAVILTASISPKFADVDQIDASPHGFVRNYTALIMRESGKDPFLGKG